MVSERQRMGRRIARRGKQSEREGNDLLAIVTTFMLAALLLLEGRRIVCQDHFGPR